eukprot:TRINITY_DN15120_c0_g1_i1.p1 TRINITY_DN15120_c0_g1~~TRINITY_DN15120_c0_g1_i1.p1  ORF type:complete len:299 (+),score=114.39 TRINITY_DN15120_c0_g1_i1:78-974(+)
MSWKHLVRVITKENKITWGIPLFESSSNNNNISLNEITQIKEVKGSPFEENITHYDEEIISDVEKFLPPIEQTYSSGIFCIGLNYKLHAEETGKKLPERPIIFMKGFNALTGHKSNINIPKIAQEPKEVDYEGELAVVIGRDCRNVTPEEGLNNVLGYCVSNDVSARRHQKKIGNGQWCFAKSFDSFCPIGPVLVSPEAIPNGDPNALEIKTTLNGQVMQHSNTNDMIFKVGELISFISKGITLRPGTIILTGTPSGVGFARNPPIYLEHGDVVNISIEHLGTLSNSVVYEDNTPSKL